MAEQSVSIWKKALQLAGENNVEAIKELYATLAGGWDRRFFVDLVLIGAANANDVAEASGVEKANYPCMKAGRWATDQGACMLFGIQQPKDKWVYENTSDKNNSLRMLGSKGPGEVAKGSFKGLS